MTAGWTNWPTEALHLWIMNDRETLTTIRGLAARCNSGSDTTTAISDLADALRDSFGIIIDEAFDRRECNVPEWCAELARSAFQILDWRQLAMAFLDDHRDREAWEREHGREVAP